jgi:hypothetical protein
MKLVVPLQFLLVCLLLLGVAVFAALFFKTKESFVGSPSVSPTTRNNDIQLQACPSGTVTYDSKGDILCCRGDIVDGLCNGVTVCSISSDTQSLPSCLRLLRNELTTKAQRSCPPSLPNYFEDSAKKSKGCCSLARTPDGKAPKQDVPGQKVCVIYETETQNYNKKDSCYNQKLVETSTCPQGSRPDLIVPQKPDHPAYLSCTLTSPRFAVPKTCYLDDSFKKYLNVAFPSWKSDISKQDFLSFCSIANKYYIEKSLTDQEIDKKKTALLD